MFTSSRPTAYKFTRQAALLIAACSAVLALTASSAFAAWPVYTPAPKSTPAASSTSASSGCASTATSNPFAQFGDNADYSLLSGGSFESGTAGWSLSNAAVVNGNESYNVAGGSQSLAIQPNGTAVSPSFCVSTANPSFRLFARRASGSWGVLNVILRWTDSSGNSHDTSVGSLQPGTSWTPSAQLKLATTLPLTQASESVSAKLVFKPEQYGGAMAIDDVYIDPRMR